MYININDILSKFNIKHIDDIYDEYDAFKYLQENNEQIISFTKTFNFYLNNVSILEMIDNKYIYECDKINGIFDMVSDINSNVDFKIKLCDKIYDNNTKIITCLGGFNDKTVLFYFNNVDDNTNFFLKFKCYIFNQDLRKYIREFDKIECDEHIHTHNIIIKK